MSALATLHRSSRLQESVLLLSKLVRTSSNCEFHVPVRHLRVASSQFGKANVKINMAQVDNGNAPCTKHPHSYALTIDTINPNIIRLEYAVRGPIVQRAGELEAQLCSGQKLPFDEVIRCNIGDAHAMDQPQITFIRELLASCLIPELGSQFADDVRLREARLLDACRGHSVGSYSDSQGLEVVRRDIAAYIERRDGHPSDWHNIFIGTGASECIKLILQAVSSWSETQKVGVMVPIPQYPLYSATNSEYGLYQVNYYLDEAKNWALDVADMKRAIDEARTKCQPRALVCINPGNPTGQVLTQENIQDVIRFAYDNSLLILADEVYQHNVYAAGSAFHSFKKVLTELPEPYRSGVQLASFMSISKGYMGECGLRGGYCELVNIPLDVRDQIYKCISAKLCPPVTAQVAVDAVVNHPQPDEASYSKWKSEKDSVLAELAYKAKLVADAFNSVPGMRCNPVQGAMYAFPRLELPEKFVAEAKKLGKQPDALYCFRLLETTGVCVVPGSGFGQREGTYHSARLFCHRELRLRRWSTWSRISRSNLQNSMSERLFGASVRKHKVQH